ncbi:hypothetical protein BT67DRAFT_312574 [Trichocladium antarcticum]|uniref:Uncharacterized protein n=1 Tax=Trichocladium antarcticum TaxID=1450529 RepID=A0AAN6UJN9_9PEZI|nr:hypothetical protein BT67DRAFT_312574 [Trichocladium antarcticum]
MAVTVEAAVWVVCDSATRQLGDSRLGGALSVICCVRTILQRRQRLAENAPGYGTGVWPTVYSRWAAALQGGRVAGPAGKARVGVGPAATSRPSVALRIPAVHSNYHSAVALSSWAGLQKSQRPGPRRSLPSRPRDVAEAFTPKDLPPPVFHRERSARLSICCLFRPSNEESCVPIPLACCTCTGMRCSRPGMRARGFQPSGSQLVEETETSQPTAFTAKPAQGFLAGKLVVRSKKSAA